MKQFFNDDLPFKFLFESWNINSTSTLVFTCIGVIVVGLAIEASKALQMFFSHHFFTLPLKKLKTEFPENQPDTSTASSDLFISDSLQYVRSRRIKNHLIQTILFAVKLFLGYVLMLAAMLYNSYVMGAVIGGSVLGYFFFSTDSLDNKQSSSSTADNRSSTDPVSTLTTVNTSTESLLNHAV